MSLSDLTVRRAQPSEKPRTLADAFGLSLFVPPQGRKAWHFRFRWGGVAERMSFGTYPEVSLQQARQMRDEARAQLARGLNPRMERSRHRNAAILAAEHTFLGIYEQWREHRKLTLEEGRQTSLSQITRVFKKDVFPVLRSMGIHDIERAHLLDIIARVEARGALSVAEKLRTWFRQLFTYATVVVPGMKHNPSDDLEVVALPLPAVEHNPFLRMPELPQFLQTLRKHRGRLNTQLAIRFLLLTGVRTGELRHATPDQFDLDKGLWFIPVTHLKQRKHLANKRRRRITDIPPYIVPLPLQAQEIVRHLLDNFKPAQVYVFPAARSLRKIMSEGTVNMAIKRMGYMDRLTGHGLRGTLSSALHELGYVKKWIDAQLSHTDADETSRAYNHARFVEQRRVMMQDWADRLDLFEQGLVEAASTPLTITLQGLPTMVGRDPAEALPVNTSAPQIVVTSPIEGGPIMSPAVYRLPAVETPEYAKPALSAERRAKLDVLKMFEAPHNVRVADYAKLVGISRRAISYQITAGKLLALDLGNRGLRVPDWQLNPLKHRLVQIILDRAPLGINAWQIYHALTQGHSALADQAPIDAVTPRNLERVVECVRDVLAEECGLPAVPTHAPVEAAQPTRAG